MISLAKKTFANTQSWIINNPKETAVLLAILLIALVARVWHLDQYLPFLGDEGRDVRVVRRFLTDFDLMFIGPRTSIGDMYLGPAYYYLIAPFLLIFNFSPVGPAFFVALLSVATVFLVWCAAREWFGKAAAIVAALLYAISPTIILFARHSWNPNIMPFFSLLTVYSAWKIWQTEKRIWFVILGAATATMVQSHYLGLLLLPTLAWVIGLSLFRMSRKDRKKFIINLFLCIGIFVLLNVPLLLFDYKHGWHNLDSMKKFFFERQSTVSAKPWNSLPQLWPYWKDQIVSSLLTARDKSWGLLYGSFVLIMFFWLSYYWKQTETKRQFQALSLLAVWLVTGLIGVGLLKQNVYDHYFGFLFPAPFLLFGAVCQGIWERKKARWVLAIFVLVLVIHNLQNNPLKLPPQRQLQRVQDINRSIQENSGGKPFNFGLIAERNYEEGYLYFFELAHAPVREIDPQRMGETLTDQLYVVCEDQNCQPINNAKAEIANFGWSKVEKEWKVDGIQIFKLVHSKP